jgi:two-component system OmpR family response regulator
MVAENRSSRHERWQMQVLIVEDEADTATTLAELIEAFGFGARIENDGRAALAWAEANEPDVVLLDIGLPGGMDGHELARRLHELPSVKPPLLVAITGSDRDEDRRRSAEVGIHLHLVKPVEPDQVHGLLRRFERVVMPCP